MSKGRKKGYKCSKETKEKMRQARLGVSSCTPSGENHYKWKGDNGGYDAMHKWVQKWKGRPNKCEVCGTEKEKYYDWANIDHKYRRVLEDYIRMCRVCHKRYDYGNHLSNIGSRGGSIKNK